MRSSIGPANASTAEVGEAVAAAPAITPTTARRRQCPNCRVSKIQANLWHRTDGASSCTLSLSPHFPSFLVDHNLFLTALFFSHFVGAFSPRLSRPKTAASKASEFVLASVSLSVCLSACVCVCVHQGKTGAGRVLLLFAVYHHHHHHSNFARWKASSGPGGQCEVPASTEVSRRGHTLPADDGAVHGSSAN